MLRAGPGWRRRFAGVWCAGLAGVASLLLQPVPQALREQATALQPWPELALRALLLVNPLLLVTVAAAIGATVAHRVGLRSALAGERDARPDVRGALVAGALLAAAITAADAAFADRLGPGWREVAARAAQAPLWPALPIGALYGGLAEEVIVRWGLMSLVAWGATRAMRRGPAAEGGLASDVAWLSVLVAAAAFAAGHLPALAAIVEPTGPIVARTLGLNLLAGVVYGWLFWRRGLETAMLAHAATHVGFALVRLLG
jgi:membrane protease YdiL (CAAX protease family)